jgi:plasmid stability protein
MAGRMVRTQIYLPADVHEKLRARAQRHGLTLALQIRAALEEYFNRLDSAEEGVLRADDPIFRFIGIGSGATSDAAFEHDHYLYGLPKRGIRRNGPRRKGYRSPSRRKQTGSRRHS